MKIEREAKNIYDQKPIKCPYCFNTFLHSEVGFRQAEKDEGKIKEYQNRCEYAESDEENEYYDKKLENESSISLKPDEVWNRYWTQRGWSMEANLFENSDGYDEYEDNIRRSVLGRPQNKVVGIDNEGIIGDKKRDDDGFVISAEDTFGRPTQRRVCPYCHNKLPKDYGKFDVKFISIVGVTGSGKTIMISSILKNIEDYAFKAGGFVTFDGDDSVNKFMHTYDVKTSSQLPKSTREHFIPPVFIRFSRKTEGALENTILVVYDIAGESCVKSNGIDKYGSFIKNSDGIIFIIDPRQFGVFEDFSGEVESPQSVIKAMSKAFLIDDSEKRHMPLAVAISKSDMLRGGIGIHENSNIFRDIDYDDKIKGFMIDDFTNINHEVKEIIKARSPILYQNIDQLFDNTGYFAFSSLGQSTDEKNVVKLNIVPKRLEEPLLWMLYKLNVISGQSKRSESQSKTTKPLWKRLFK